MIDFKSNSSGLHPVLAQSCRCVGSSYSSINMTVAWKKLCCILSVRSDFHMTDSHSIAVHAFACRVLMSVLVDETLLLINMNSSLKSYNFAKYLH